MLEYAGVHQDDDASAEFGEGNKDPQPQTYTRCVCNLFYICGGHATVTACNFHCIASSSRARRLPKEKSAVERLLTETNSHGTNKRPAQPADDPSSVAPSKRAASIAAAAKPLVNPTSRK